MVCVYETGRREAQFEVYNVDVETSKPGEYRYLRCRIRKLHTGDDELIGVAMRIYGEASGCASAIPA